jgi:predicted acyl esterase
MLIRLSRLIVATIILSAGMVGSVLAQETRARYADPPFSLPDDITVRKATIWSEGTRIVANIYSPKNATGKLPTIIMAYGWGGTMERFRTEGAAFAQAGYLVVMFDYRGWGESDSRVILSGPAPAERSGHRFTAEVVELREILDPLAEVQDLSNVIHWVQAEPQSDTSRIEFGRITISRYHVLYSADQFLRGWFLMNCASH